MASKACRGVVPAKLFHSIWAFQSWTFQLSKETNTLTVPGYNFVWLLRPSGHLRSLRTRRSHTHRIRLAGLQLPQSQDAECRNVIDELPNEQQSQAMNWMRAAWR